MKRILSIDGWNPERLKTGDRVICITRGAAKDHIHTGIVGLGYNYPEEEEKRKIAREKNEDGHYGEWYIIDDISGKKLYPYTKDTCLIGPGLNEVNKVGCQIVEL